MKIKFVLILITITLFQNCNENDEPINPPCIENIIISIQEQDVWNPPAKIYSYRYDNQFVFFIPQRCCDIPSQLLDENCNFICSPDGGIIGSGDGECPDFFDNRTDEYLLWEDDRE
ncbi:DUF6970 domain-containing protein [Urechidicola croceus]|uniref:DUF6970 domain-containing protein n=1 Tax=Urechidicola croceus TaxID=1850246 RepID=A0A1D8P5Z3_9FLAO|nr:hypothetical protein [Urechidicola croceus]AOW19972.1 hypothetical protein LPB138_04410 [Urechidicola croceus]